MLSTREKADTAHIFLQDEFATFRMGFKQINLLRDGIKTLISFKINDSGNTIQYRTDCICVLAESKLCNKIHINLLCQK